MGFGSGEGFTPGRHSLVGDFTVEGNMSASAAISGAFFFGDGSFLQNVTGSGGAASSIAVGNDVDSGTANRVLYENSSNDLAESANLTFDGTTLAAPATTVTSLSGTAIASALQAPYITASMGALFKRNADNADRSPLVAISGASGEGVAGANQASLWVSGSGVNTQRGVVHVESHGPYTISLLTRNDNTNIIYRAGQGLDDSGDRQPKSETNIAFKMAPPADIGATDLSRTWALGVDCQEADYRRFRITNKSGVAISASSDYGFVGTGSFWGFNLNNPAHTLDINGGLCVTGSTILGTNATSSTTIVGSLDLSDGNIANVGDLDCDSVSVADAANGLDIQFGGTTGTNKITLTDDLADALNINEGGNSYLKFTTTNGSEQIVVGKDSTFASTTIADLGTVTTATSITATDLIGTNVDGIIGADTARAGTFAAIVGTSLNVSEGNITNVGDINCDSVSVDDAAVGLDIQMGGNTGLNKVTLTDDLADALNITEGSNSYLKFTTSNGSEQIVVGKNSTFAGTTIANLGTVTTATSITATDLIGTNVDGIIGADTARAGTFAAIVGTSLNVSEGNITNVGDINCDSISVDDAAVGLDIQMGGNTSLNKITLTDDLADALNITEGSNSYLKFTTSNGSEEIVVAKNMACLGTLGVDGNVTLGDSDGDTVTLKGVPSIVGVSDTSPADLYFKADQSGGDEDIDNWLVRASDGGTLSINNKASTSYVAQMTLYPHATQASSLTKVEGQLLAGAALLVGQPNAPTSTGTTQSNNLTIANLLTRIVYNSNGAAGAITYTLPTAAAIVAGLTSAIGNAVAGITFDFSVINVDASQDITVATNTGLTLVGGTVVEVGESATFRVYITNHVGSSEAASIFRLA
jgi:hypothetical protein